MDRVHPVPEASECETGNDWKQYTSMDTLITVLTEDSFLLPALYQHIAERKEKRETQIYSYITVLLQRRRYEFVCKNVVY